MVTNPLTDLIEFFQQKQPATPGDREYNAAFCRLLVAAAGTDEASIWQLDTENELHLIYSTDIPQYEYAGFTLREGEGISGAVALACQTLCVADAWRDPHHDRRVDEHTGLRTHSMVSAPVLFDGTIFGVLNIVNLASPKAIPNEWKELLSAIAILYAAALARAGRLIRLSVQPDQRQKKKGKDVIPQKAKTSVVGISRPIQEALNLCLKAGRSDIPVLIRGETGTGKELAARRIHEGSLRAKGSFLAVNCAALTETLLESELFGHVKGAFTGATHDREGKFVAASGGTLFLDEIGEMSLASQAKILRAIEEHKVTPVGSEKAVPYDARIVAATNTDLKKRVTQLKFRDDLYYRLCGIEIVMPPLRERLEDIHLLAVHFLKKAAEPSLNKHCQPPLRLSPEALEMLIACTWPGNIRQLEQALYAAAAFCEEEEIKPEDFPAWLHEATKQPPSAATRESPEDAVMPEPEDSPDEERVRYLNALNATRYAGSSRWNLSAAAREIGMPRKTFAYRLKKLGIVK